MGNKCPSNAKEGTEVRKKIKNKKQGKRTVTFKRTEKKGNEIGAWKIIKNEPRGRKAKKSKRKR